MEIGVEVKFGTVCVTACFVAIESEKHSFDTMKGTRLKCGEEREKMKEQKRSLENLREKLET
ncbi:hypothetical protein PIB30_071426, partial [Stylosanthes scabra]|nr:hypothetical protein [Stylosanthes scabra]